jgi:hypothetical protein
MTGIAETLEMSARQEILALVYQYSFAYDSNDMELLGSVFREDGSTGGVVADSDIGWGPWKGRANIVAELSQIRCSQADRRRHVITSPVFEELTANTATVKVYLSLFSYGDGKEPHLVTIGEYTMKASQRDGIWLMDSLDEILASPF